MKKNTRWSALLISIFVTGVILLMTIYLLDKILPAARNIKGIENSNVAYYHATTAIEGALYAMSRSNPSFESATTIPASGTGYAYSISATGTTIPKPGTGNSEYDSAGEWNKLGYGQPLQLVLKNGINWDMVVFQFRIPDLNRNGNWLDESLSVTSSTPIINWIVSGNGKILYASGSTSMITAAEMNTPITLHSEQGKDLSGIGGTFSEFYGGTWPFTGQGLGNCDGFVCTLKLSLIAPLPLSTGESAPYLEYRIFGLNTPIPFQFATIEATGKSQGFKRDLTRRIQQITTNEAIDFTVFQ